LGNIVYDVGKDRRGLWELRRCVRLDKGYSASMAGCFLGLLFLSGMPICVFLLPSSWFPWSLIGWFIGFVVMDGMLRAVARRWRGKPMPSGVGGVVVGLAIAVTGDSDGSGDGGGDGGGGGD
jgi:hypothetical protein